MSTIVSLLRPIRRTCILSNLSYKRQELLIIREHMCSPPVFGGVSVAHIFSFMRCVFVFVLYLAYPMWPDSLDCLFLIAPSIFSNVY